MFFIFRVMMHHLSKFYSCFPFIDFSIFSCVTSPLCSSSMVEPSLPHNCEGWSGLNNPTDRQRDKNRNIINPTHFYRKYRKQRKEKRSLTLIISTTCPLYHHEVYNDFAPFYTGTAGAWSEWNCNASNLARIQQQSCYRAVGSTWNMDWQTRKGEWWAGLNRRTGLR